MNDVKKDRFSCVLYALPERISAVLSRLPEFLKNETFEIRLRRDRPVCLTASKVFYISSDAVASTLMPKNPLVISKNELKEVILRITDRSIYAHTKELKKGYLSMRKGCRAGVCGSFSGGGLDVTSVNIRIAREIKGCADKLLPLCEKGLLIAGPPGSGKTTLLRDLVRQISDMGKRVCLVDTRGEICGDGLDVGVNTDVIVGCSKAEGAEIALRTMFPQYIAFDEVGNGRELELIKESFFAGVAILTTAHAESLSDLQRRSVIKGLLGGAIENAVLLERTPGGGFLALKGMEEGIIA